MDPEQNDYSPRHKICVSGAAETGNCGEGALHAAEQLGKEIAEHDAVLVEGATTGFPYWAAKGAKMANGIVVGFSPATGTKEHVDFYKLPTDFRDLIVYTGFGYSGRNLILTRAADAVIVGCGRIGTINEFTIAFEDNKPIGVLEGEWETDETLRLIVDRSDRAEERAGRIIFEKDPKILIEKLLVVVEKDKKNNHQPTSYRV